MEIVKLSATIAGQFIKIKTIVYEKKGFYALLTLSLGACNTGTAKDATAVNINDSTKSISTMMPNQQAFTQTIDSKQTNLYLLKNSNGMQLAITNYGGRFIYLIAPDKIGNPVNVIVGFDSVQQFKQSTGPYYGATIGRYGNRIAKGKFSLDGTTYQLSVNNGPNTLHGGKNGFQYKVWDAKQAGDSVLELSYLSKDGEEGFPGNLQVKVTYSLTQSNEIKMEYEATTDKKTVINLTSHAFFNLNGAGSGTINNHLLMINADNYTPVDATLIPTGKIETVKGTPFDFTTATKIGNRVNDTANIQIKNGAGYDHNFVLNLNKGTGLNLAATALGDKTGIYMEVFTQEPGLQFYGGNFMQGKNTISGGGKDDFRTAFCLETQHFPDAPNHPSFPTTILLPGKMYKTVSLYKFSVK